MKTIVFATLLIAGATQIPAQIAPGYVLVPAQGGGMSSTSGSILVDSKGATVKSFSVGGYNSYLTTKGTIVGQTGTGSASAAGFGSLVEQSAGSSTALTTWTTSGFHHGHWLMPNGHWLGTVAVKINPKTALASAGYTGALTSIYDERIQEWDPVSKTVVWEWKASDHTSGANHPRKFNSNTIFKSSDPLHINSVVYDSARDLIAMSSHYMNELLVIDHSTATAQAATSTGGKYGKGGDLLFRWGASKNYGAGGAAMSNVVHGGGVIQAGLPGAGNFSLFGNTDNTVKHSRYYEVKGQESDTGWVIGSNGEFVADLAFDWYSAAGTYESSGHYGYGQRLSNGNTLLTFSGSSKIVEVDAQKAIQNVISAGSIRAIHYPLNHPGIVALGLGTSSVSSPGGNLSLAASFVNGRIVASGLAEGVQVRVVDLNGQLRFDGTANGGSLAIATSGWAKGTYVLQVVAGASTASTNFALTH